MITTSKKPVVDIQRASQVGLVVKNLSANAGDLRDLGLIPGTGSSPGGGHGHPLQYSCLENPMTEESGGLQSTESQRVRRDQIDLAHSTTFLNQPKKLSSGKNFSCPERESCKSCNNTKKKKKKKKKKNHTQLLSQG